MLVIESPSLRLRSWFLGAEGPASDGGSEPRFCSMEVSLGCLRICCGVLLISVPFAFPFFRSGDVDLPIKALREALLLFPAGAAASAGLVCSPGGEKESSRYDSPNTSGLGSCFQPGTFQRRASRVAAKGAVVPSAYGLPVGLGQDRAGSGCEGAEPSARRATRQ